MTTLRFRRLRCLPWLWLAALTMGCGSSGAPHRGTDTGGDGSAGAVPLDAGTLATRVAAATETAQSDPLCSAISPFYWEIGDATGSLGGASVGGTTYTVDTVMGIASASKFLFGAYVVERFKDDLGAIDLNAMRMLSGYIGLDYTRCLTTTTVNACFETADTMTTADVERFYYNGGHFQKYAVDLGLGADSAAALGSDVSEMLGTELGIAYSSPQLAGGARMSAGDYAKFLRKILSGGLALSAHLGENPVCTLPGSSCRTAAYSPAPAAWHYSYAHWVEDDPATGDGSFSSPGAYGFYPWIDRTKTYYGIVARQSLGADTYIQSVECGIQIRKAFFAGVAD